VKVFFAVLAFIIGIGLALLFYFSMDVSFDFINPNREHDPSASSDKLVTTPSHKISPEVLRAVEYIQKLNQSSNTTNNNSTNDGQKVILLQQQQKLQEVKNTLLSVFRHGHYAKDRRFAANGLAKLKDPEVDKELFATLENPQEDFILRQNLAYSFGRRGEMKAIPALSKVLQESQVNKTLLKYAISALGSIPSQEAGKPLLKFVSNYTDGEYRVQAARALRRQGLVASHAWGRWSKDRSIAIRVIVTKALGAKQNKKARQILIGMALSDEDYGVRLQAIGALEPWREDGATRDMINRIAHKDSNDQVRQKAKDFLSVKPK